MRSRRCCGWRPRRGTADADGLQHDGASIRPRRRSATSCCAPFPSATIAWAVDAKRQRIVDSWPAAVDDAAARRDWGFAPVFDFARAFDDVPDPAHPTSDTGSMTKSVRVVDSHITYALHRDLATRWPRGAGARWSGLIRFRPGRAADRVVAAGVNRPDVMQRRGVYPPPPGASDIPGLEVAGTVVARRARRATAGVKAIAVCALVAGGGYATLCVAPAPQCLPVPTRLDAVSAAAIPETFFTVWTNVFDRGRLRAGRDGAVSRRRGRHRHDRHPAGGRRVAPACFATAGSDEKCRACEQLGAARAINYRTRRLRAKSSADRPATAASI